VSDCSLRSLRIRALNPPPSSSLAKEERLRSFLLHAPARDPYLIARFRSLQTAL